MPTVQAVQWRVAVAHRPPFIFVNDGGNGSTLYSGMLIELLNRVIATQSEAAITYSLYTSPTNAGGTLDSNGAWSGVVGELVYGRADVVLFPLTRTASRLSAIDCTFSYLDQGLSLLIRDEQHGPGPLSVLEPFKMTLWLTLLCTVVGVAVVFWLLDLYSKWIRTRQTRALRRTGVLTGRAAARAKQDEDSHVFISFMAAAGAPERPRRSSWGVQVLYLAYCFFCLIVLSSYTANLTSFLAVRRAAVGIQGLQDLVRDNALIGVNPNGSTAAYFASSQDTLATQLQPRVRYCASDTCLAWLRAGEVSAFVSDQPLLDYIAQQQPCDLQVVGDPFGPGNLVIGLQKGSPWLPLFNNAMQAFSEDGTLSTLYRTWFDGLSQCDDGTAAILDSSRLGVDQMLGAFVFLLFGALAAFAISNCENLKWCLVRAYSTPSAMSRMSSNGGVRSSWHRISSNLLGVNDLLEEAGVAPWPNPQQPPLPPGAEPQALEQQQAQPDGWGQPPCQGLVGKGGALDPNGNSGAVHVQADQNGVAVVAAQQRQQQQQQQQLQPMSQWGPHQGPQHGPPGGPGMRPPHMTASGRVLPGAAAAGLVGLVSRKSGFTHSPRFREPSDLCADVDEADDAAEGQQEAVPVQEAAAVAISHAATAGRRHGTVELRSVAAAPQQHRADDSTIGRQGGSSRDRCSSEREPHQRGSSYLLQPTGTMDSCTLLLPRGARSSDGRSAVPGVLPMSEAVAGAGAAGLSAGAAPAAGAQAGGGSSWRRNPLAASGVAGHHAGGGDTCGAGIDEEEVSNCGSSCSGTYVSGSALDVTHTGTSGQDSSGDVWGSAAEKRNGGRLGGGSSSNACAGAGSGGAGAVRAYRPPSLVQATAHAHATARPGSRPPPPIQLQLLPAQQQWAPAASHHHHHHHRRRLSQHAALDSHPQLPTPQPQPQQRAPAGLSGLGQVSGGCSGGGSSSGGSSLQPPVPQPQVATATREGGSDPLAASAPQLPLVPPALLTLVNGTRLPLPPSGPPRPSGTAASKWIGLGSVAGGSRTPAPATGILAAAGPAVAAAESPLASPPPAWALTSGGGTSNPDTAMASFVTAPDATMSTLNHSGPVLNIAAGPATATEHAQPGSAALPATGVVGTPSPRRQAGDGDGEDAYMRGGESIVSFLCQPPLAPSRW